MYALISVYDDTNKCICDSKVLLPDSVETTEYSDVPYKKHKFSFTVTTSKMYQAMVNGKLKHDDIPEPETNEWMDQEVENGERAADDFVNKLDNSSQPVKSRVQVCLKDLEVGQTFYWRELDYDTSMVVWKDYIKNRIHYIDKHGTFSKGGDTKVWIKKTDDIPEDESEEAKAEQAFLKRHKRMMENSMYGLSVNQCMICKKVIYDDKAICDRCFKIAKREGFLE